MKKQFNYGFEFYASIIVAIGFFGVLAFAEVATTTPNTPSDFLTELMTLIGGWAGMASQVAGLAVIRLIFTFFNSSLGSFAGVWQQVIASAIAVIVQVIAGLVGGSSIAQIIVSGTFGAAFQTFAYELLQNMGILPQVPAAPVIAKEVVPTITTPPVAPK